jgi:hypothetical protein
MLWKNKHDRLPTVDELTHDGQIALGKKVFEYLDYRDQYYPTLTDAEIYVGCLSDHGVERSVGVDGLDVAIDRKLLSGCPVEMTEQILYRYDLILKKRGWYMKRVERRSIPSRVAKAAGGSEK